MVSKLCLYVNVRYNFGNAVHILILEDNNPIHLDQEVAKASIFGGTIVHGILVSSLFSTILGRSIPGAVYVSQSLFFKKPVHVGMLVTAEITVTKVDKIKKGDLVVFSTICKLSDGVIAVDGEGKVLVLK